MKSSSKLAFALFTAECFVGGCLPAAGPSSTDTFRVISASLASDATTDITLGWEAPANPAVTALRIERSATPSGPWTAIAELAPSTLLFTDGEMPGPVAHYRLVELVAEVPIEFSDPLRVLSVADLEYQLENEVVPGIDFATSLFGVVRHPTDLSDGPYPLVLLLHGNHGNCRDPQTREDVCVTQTTQDCNEPGFVTTPNAHGYVYLQETLAAQGFVTVSLGANALNCRNQSSNFVAERTQLILEHLRRWSTWNGPGAPPFGTLFSGAVDLSRVSLFGHSRGGAAVSRSPAQLQATPIASVSLASAFALAPTDDLTPDPSGERFAGLIPGCDGDVRDLVGVRHFDRTLFDTADPNPRAQVFFIGANHNFFNTEWLNDENMDPDVMPVCSPEQQVGGPAQRALLETAFSDWVLRATENAGLPDYMRTDAGTPEVIEAWAESALDLRWSYAATSRLVIDDFRTRSDPDFNTLLGLNTYTDFAELTWFDSCPQSCRFPHRKQALRTTWSGPANASIDGFDLDASAFPTLSMRFASSVQAIAVDPGTVEHDFTIRVRDTAGAVAEVSLASTGRLAHGYPALAAVQDVLSTVRVDFAEFLADNAQLDLSHLMAVEFAMPGNGSSTGAVWLSDIELVSE